MTQSEPNDPNISDLSISRIYQESATEMPGASIDQKILNLAKQNLRSKPNTKTPNFSSRKWQWPISIAASVMLVSVIFIHNQPVFLEPVESTVSEFNQTSDISLNTSNLDSQDFPTKVSVELLDEQSLAAPKVQRSSAKIETARVTDKQDTSKSTDTKLMKEHQALQQSIMKSERKLRAESSFEADIDRSKKAQNENDIIAVAGSRMVAARDAEVTEIEAMQVTAMKGSELTMESFSTLDIDYLDALVLDLKTLENNKQPSLQVQQVTAFNSQEMRTKETDVISKEERLQQAIYDELLAFKTANPDVKLPEKYLTVLAKNQLIDLLKAVEQDQSKSVQDKDIQ